MKNASIQQLLNWLEEKGLLQRRHQAEAFLLIEPVQETPISFWGQALLGAGALLACILILGFLVLGHMIHFNQKMDLFITGFLMMPLAFLIYKFRNSRFSGLNLFLIQISALLMILGKILFIFGLMQFNMQWVTVLALLIMTLATYFIYPIALDRFLSSLALLNAVLLSTLFQFEQDNVFFLFFALLIAITFFLFSWKNKTAAYTPFTYACVITLCISATLLIIYYPAGPSKYNIVLGIWLIALCFHLAGPLFRLASPVLFTSFLLAILSIVANAGMLLSIALLILGHGKREKPLSIIGGVALVLFFLTFFYQLKIPLAHKSLTLTTSGILLLLLYWLMKQLRWEPHDK